MKTFAEFWERVSTEPSASKELRASGSVARVKSAAASCAGRRLRACVRSLSLRLAFHKSALRKFVPAKLQRLRFAPCKSHPEKSSPSHLMPLRSAPRASASLKEVSSLERSP